MIIHQTELQKEVAKEPTKLDFETVRYNRGLITTDTEKYAYNRLVAGEMGEATVLKYLKEYGREHWIVVPNLWMNHFGPFEPDLILLTTHKPYVFEIKQFKGEYSYNDGISKIDNIQRNIHPIHQARRNYKNVQEMVNKVYSNMTVEGALIFSGVDNFVDIQSEVHDLQIVPRNYLYVYIRKIIQEENRFKETPLNTNTLLSQFEKYEIENSFLPEPLSKEEMAKVQKGIYCANCKSYNVQIKRYTITCKCGFIETREEATVRTICDYGVLNFDKELTKKELLVFFDGQVSRNYLSKILDKHFTKVNKGGHSYNINKKLPYSKLSFKYDK